MLDNAETVQMELLLVGGKKKTDVRGNTRNTPLNVDRIAEILIFIYFSPSSYISEKHN